MVFGTSVAVDEPTTPDEPTETTTPTTVEPTEPPEDIQEFVVQIDMLLDDANAALADGDLGLYQSKVDEATLLIDALRNLVEEAAP